MIDTTSMALGVTNRIVHGLIGGGAIVAILAGYVTAPIWMFTLTMISIYLCMTVATGYDPLHSLFHKTKVPGYSNATMEEHMGTA